MITLVFASQNKHKVGEIQQISGGLLSVYTPDEVGITEEIPETGNTFESNALQKAKYIFDHSGKDCFADDSGLEIDALNGEPGVYSARYAGEDKNSDNNMDLVLSKLENTTNRTARFKTVICLILKGNIYYFTGEVPGEILYNKTGGKGFGYDPIFKPNGYNQSFAEMTAEEKNAISHRARAFAQMINFLKETV